MSGKTGGEFSVVGGGWAQCIRAIKMLSVVFLSLSLVTLISPYAINQLPGEPVSQKDVDLFGDFYKSSVDYSRLKLHRSSEGDIFLNLIGGVNAFAFGDVVIIRTKIEAPPAKKNYLSYVKMHEFAHHWQYQNCGSWTTVLKRAFELAAAGKIHGLYDYKLEEGKDLSEFGMEQQATILADYFALQTEDDTFSLYVKGGVSKEVNENLLNKTLSKFLENPSYIKKRGCPR